MPRLSLWRPEKGNDYKFFDRTMSEMFTVGGVDILIHKYLGPIQQTGSASATEPTYLNDSVKNIQDLLFLENRDRKYDTSVYTLRGLYRISDNDFDLTQFGLFLTGDTIFMVFHLNDMVETLGRKIMVGDVLELPHLKEYYPLDEGIPVALKQFFVVQDATRSAEGFAPTWYPHLWRVKLGPLVDSQEYKDIINQIKYDSDGDGVEDTPISDILSTYDKYIQVNDAVIQRAEEELPKSGYDTSSFYVLPVNPDGSPADVGALDASQAAHIKNGGVIDASATTKNTSEQEITPSKKVSGYLTGDTLLPSGYAVAAGTFFPTQPHVGDYYLRLDYQPNRLFRYDGKRWVKVEDAVRTNLTPGPDNKTQLSGFINNQNARYSGALARDVIKVSDPYIPEANSRTVSFTLSTNSVVTDVIYNAAYGVKTYHNNSLVTGTKANVSGNFGFTISANLSIGDRVEYTVYSKVLSEKQNLSQALRPKADN